MQNFVFLLPTCLIVAFAAVGIWLLVTSVKQILLKRQHLPHMERVQGTVIGVEQRETGAKVRNGQTTTSIINLPIVQFTPSSGEVVKFISEKGDISVRRTSGLSYVSMDGKIVSETEQKTFTGYQKGDTLTVLYDPDGAVKPIIEDGSNVWMTEIFMTLGGAALVLAALVIVLLFGGRIIAQLPF